MNKTNIALIAFLFLGLAVPAPAAFQAGQKLQISLSAASFFGSDSLNRETYGDSAFLPEFSLACSPWKSVFLWSDLGFLSQDGVVSELNEPASNRQLHLALGLGYRILNGGRFRLSAILGLALQHMKEEAMDLESSHSALGYKLGLQADYSFLDHWFLHLAATYKQASFSDDLDDLNMKLGGFSLGGGLGFAF